MNKLWCFGDSFTYGHGCRPGYEYFDKGIHPAGTIWTTLIAKSLSLEEVNLGIPGNAMPNILNQIIYNLKNFKKGDHIILTNTLPIRVMYPNIERTKIEHLTTDLLLYPDNPMHLKEHKDHLKLRFKRKEDRYDIVNYISSAVLPNTQLWLNHYTNQLIEVQNYLLKFEMEVFFWDYSIWNSPKSYLNFETIDYDTKGKIKDGHWSWQGHKDFAEYLLKRISKKEYQYKPTLI